MSTEFRLPELGENIEKGDLLRVLVAVGDQISKDQPVIELETDKATLEVPSSIGGKVESVNVKAGEQVKVGQVILTVTDGANPSVKSAGEAKPESREPKSPANGTEPKIEQAAPDKTGESGVSSAQEDTQENRQTPPAGSATVEFRLPELGENIEKGDLLKVLVSVGDMVTKDQAVIELETDKATLEVPSSVAGKVKEIHVKAGEKVKIGQLILTLEGGAEADAAVRRPVAAQSGQISAAAQTAGPQAKPPADGKAIEAAPAAEPVGQGGTIVVPPIPAEQAPKASAAEPATKILVPAAPSVRRIAREFGVDITQVTGTGPAGRISAEDIKSYVKALNHASGAGGTKAPRQALPLPDFTRWGNVEREPMRAVRRSTATRMANAWTTIPHVTQHDKADITQLEQFRKQYSKKAAALGAKPTVTAVALKVVASALKRFPQFAASIDPAREEILYKKYCHVGVAVDTDRGLLVPVIRDVDRKNILELSIELAEAAEKARNRKLTPENMEGGVFTITNLGGIGGTSFTPIVNWPEVAILGISRSSLEPVYIEDEFQPRLMLPLSLSYDHRLIDGADAARFLRWVAEAMEQPFLVPFEG